MDFYYTNDVLKKMIEEYGDRIFMIQLDNAHKIFFGTPQSDGNIIQLSDLIYKTVNGTDLFGFRRIDRTWDKEVPWLQWWTTAFIQTIGITEAEMSPQGDLYLPDINKFY